MQTHGARRYRIARPWEERREITYTRWNNDNDNDESGERVVNNGRGPWNN